MYMSKQPIFRGVKDNKSVLIYHDDIMPLLEIINLRNEHKVSYLGLLDINSFLNEITECYYCNENYIKLIDNKYRYIYN